MNRMMKQIIFNQRVTVFTNSFIGYSTNYQQALYSKFGNKMEIGMLPTNLSIIPQQIIFQNQIPLNSPWFIKSKGIKVEFMPNKIDILSDLFITKNEEEVNHLRALTDFLSQINEAISIGSITRMAYAPSFGLEFENEKIPVDNYWESIIKIPDLADSRKQEKMVRYNAKCKQSFCNYKDIVINRVITISEGTRIVTRPISSSNSDSNDSKAIECVIVSIDINTSGITGNYSVKDVYGFCEKAQLLGHELMTIINK